jgi:PAS domain S-box-containing protein
LSDHDRFKNLLFEAFPIGLAISHMDGHFIYVNEAYSSMTGYNSEEALMLTYWQVTPIDFEKQEQEQLASLTETGRYGPYKSNTYTKTATGSRFACLEY